MMNNHKWRTFAIVGGLALLIVFVANRMLTYHWHVEHIHQAASLTLYDPEETLTGNDLHAFMNGFQASNTRYFDLQCTLRRRAGFITIHEREYPVELLHDKFAGDVLIVQMWGKATELVRAHRYWPGEIIVK